MLGGWWLLKLAFAYFDPRVRRIALLKVVIPTIFASAGARSLVYAHGMPTSDLVLGEN